MTLDDRNRVGTILLRIVRAEYGRAQGIQPLFRRGLQVLIEQAHQMGLAPEDVLSPDGHDAFIAIARAIFSVPRPKKPSGIMSAEWRTVMELTA